ncbi:MAG TPA: hypothetical protein VJ804_04535, partial [Acidimicrobiales bacterium]|nr:hypothetical protein [Acidimicrobiales bacterium]
QVALTERLVDEVYPALQAAHPGARILHVGYPHVVPRPAVQLVGCPWLTRDEQDAALAAADGVEAAITAAVLRAKEAGVRVERVDVSGALEGHEVCSAEPWVNPPGTPEQFHPTAEGYAAIAQLVAAALRG